METIAIIPARYGSTRLPAKPLALIGGEPMVWRVYQRVAEALGYDNVYVATDHEDVAEAVTSRGGNAIIAAGMITCGTERCEKALRISGRKPDVVINVQGDEPFIRPDHILKLANCFNSPEVEIATIARRFNPEEDFEALFSPDSPKVVMDENNDALYFSRSIIPYVRDKNWKEWIYATDFYMHIGTYAFRPETLKKVVALPVCAIEKAEKLEQLRWLNAGFRIRVAITDSHLFSIDTPADLDAANDYFRKHLQ